MTQPTTQLPRAPRARVITGTEAEQELHAMGLSPSSLTRPCVPVMTRARGARGNCVVG